MWSSRVSVATEGDSRLATTSFHQAPRHSFLYLVGAQLPTANDGQDFNCLRGERRTINKTSTAQESAGAIK